MKYGFSGQKDNSLLSNNRENLTGLHIKSFMRLNGCVVRHMIINTWANKQIYWKML